MAADQLYKNPRNLCSGSIRQLDPTVTKGRHVRFYAFSLIGAEDVVLSNESSANESTVSGSDVNHQYSKSYTFERDFTAYARDALGLPIRYFSLLRPFNEMQIAKQFASVFSRIFSSEYKQLAADLRLCRKDVSCAGGKAWPERCKSLERNV